LYQTQVSVSETCTFADVRTLVDDIEKVYAVQLYKHLVTTLYLMWHGGVLFYLCTRPEAMLAAVVVFCANNNKTAILSVVSAYLPDGLELAVSSFASFLEFPDFSALSVSDIQWLSIIFGGLLFNKWVDITENSWRYRLMLRCKKVLCVVTFLYEVLCLLKGCMDVLELRKGLGCKTDFGKHVTPWDSQLPGMFLQLHVMIITTRLLAWCNLCNFKLLWTLINSPPFPNSDRVRQIQSNEADEWRSHLSNMIGQAILVAITIAVEVVMNAQRPS
jgi:hypothetical protein